ncbi:iron complex transport system substrate-binding protein [Haloactinopolyspora alba]|uniref:Iron complex transport system substrate-binding protein n=1 Tax=Haloactinopolyspora alba TaxID=648780 RepID=A0A2P8EFG9_9ACTN|nr:iron complex transport system substrate-binding protein [Haloactinopolyspora alba]
MALLAAACGGDGPAASTGTAGGGHYPVTVENCGAEVTFEAPPERVILLKSAPVPILRGLGVLDSVVLRAGAFPPEYYDDETDAAIEAVPSLGDDVDETGHLRISEEVVINEQPDLVLGLPDGITREGLADVGIASLVQPVMCPEGAGATRFDDIYAQVDLYGRIFGREARAADYVAELRDRVEKIRAEADGQQRTAAVLFPTVGGGSTYAYGNHSMAHPQLEAAGLANVFADADERVFEVSTETLIQKDPDVLVLLHVDGEPGPVEEAVLNLPGAGAMTAVRNGDILVQLFNFTEPPTPLSVDGLARITERFGPG